jgi:hypothetical protein
VDARPRRRARARRARNTIGSFTSVGDSTSLEAGTRLLVSGDDGYAWSCGFTQDYDESVADQWRDAPA